MGALLSPPLLGLALLAQVAQVAAVEPIEDVAAEAGVEVTALADALHSVRQVWPSVTARQYLVQAGELAPPWSPPAAVRSVWDELATCESGQRWSIATGNGFFGGLQFDRQTWLDYGGGAYAPTANLASRVQQIAVAERVHAARGFQPWPACSRRIGLR